MSLPIVSLDAFLRDPPSRDGQKEADSTARALIEFGAVIVKDSRVSEQANEEFLDLMEDYFMQPHDVLQHDARPEYSYQVGVTLENTERPKCHSDESCRSVIAALDPAERPLDLQGDHADPKCRFFYRMGKTPESTKFPSLSMENVTPAAFRSRWVPSMEAWGKQMKQAVEDVARMLALGLGLDEKTLLEAGEYGPHLLAPTATDLEKYGKLGEIFAGFHTGLHIWARNTGKRIAVKLPAGHLLVQAGKQLEHLTGGLILAGYHEVVCTPATLEAIARRKAEPALVSRPSIRISSTFFWHLSSDYWVDADNISKKVKVEKLVGKGHAGPQVNEMKYPRKQAGTLVEEELRHIALMA